MIKKLLIHIFIALIISTFFSQSYALKKETHQKINEYIATNTLNGFSLNYYLQYQLGIEEGTDEEFDSEKVWWWLGEGGKKEDEPFLRTVNHFHNPLTDKGLIGDSAIQWFDRDLYKQSPGGYYSWDDVRYYFYNALTGGLGGSKETRERNYAKTFRGLGQLMHLVQDMSVPEHTRDDAHPIIIDESKYEKWVGDEVTILAYPPIYFNKSALSNPNPIVTSVPAANLFDTNQYNGTNPEVTTQGNVDVGLSEYTNANYVSEDTIFSVQFPYPSLSSDNAEPSATIEDSGIIDPRDPYRTVTRKYYRKIRHGDTGYRLATVPFLIEDAFGVEKVPAILDDEVFSDYAQRLVPRAVGYSAGLLDYFFRGDIDMVSDDTGSDYVIVNKTEEEMDGLFELFYDNTSDTRMPIWSGNFVLGTASSGNNKSDSFNFPEPDDAKLPGKYILVFQGRLGNEEEAVVGKVINIVSDFYLRITCNGNICTLGGEIVKIEFSGISVEQTKTVEPGGLVGPFTIDAEDYGNTELTASAFLYYKRPSFYREIFSHWYECAPDEANFHIKPRLIDTD